MTQVTINGHTYSDDGTAAKDMLNGGHRTHFFPLVQDVVTVSGQVATNAASASADAASAAAVATAMRGTSTTSLTVGTGSQTLTTQASKQFSVGNYLTISRTSSPTTLMHGVVTAYNSGTGSLTVSVGVAAGSGTFTDWTIAVSGAQGATGPSGNGNIPYLAKTGAYTVAAGDAAKLIDITSGTFTLAFQACATLGANWATFVRNSGTGDVTLDPNASETIDGLTSFVMYPGEARLIVCDGTSLRSVVLQPFCRSFTSTGTFTKPPGYLRFAGHAWGAGAGGGKATNGSSAANGGGGGACFPFNVPASLFSATETVTIGAGGTGSSSAGTAGADGGSTSIGSTIVAYGGFGAGNGGGLFSDGGPGNSSSGFSTGQGFGGAATYSNSAPYGASAYGGAGATTGATPTGGSSIYGGGAGGSVTSGGTAGAAGTSKLGGSGGAAAAATSGSAGSAKGGGGGATQTGTKGGDGGRGELEIWGVC